MTQSEHFRSALTTLEQIGCKDKILMDQVRGMLDKAQHVETAALRISAVVRPSLDPISNGLKVMASLIEDGWTPPEGLI